MKFVITKAETFNKNGWSGNSGLNFSGYKQ